VALVFGLGGRVPRSGTCAAHPASRYNTGMLILASASPRRAELLAAAGFTFEVAPQAVDEAVRPGETPEAYVVRVAWEKVHSACRKSGTVVIGADTAVVIDGEILGKPRDDRDAADMLKRLSGRTHDVLTGVVLRGDQLVSDLARTAVRFLPLADAEIGWYVASGEPRDKAGAYAIQGLASRFVDHIEGSYSNVVGLPIALVSRLLRRLGVEG
jgi:septum formation protein